MTAGLAALTLRRRGAHCLRQPACSACLSLAVKLTSVSSPPRCTALIKQKGLK